MPTITGAYLGATQVQKIYQGSSLIWQRAPTGDATLLLHYDYKTAPTNSNTRWPNKVTGGAPANLTGISVVATGLQKAAGWGNLIQIPIPAALHRKAGQAFTLIFRARFSALPHDLFNSYMSTTTAYPYASVSTTGIWNQMPKADLSGEIGTWFGGTFADNTFYTWAFVYNGALDWRMYRNGTLAAAATLAGPIVLNNNPTIEFAEAQATTAIFQFIRLYSRALTASEVAARVTD